MRRALGIAALALLVLAAPAAGYESELVGASGTLRGFVRFAGKPPRLESVEITKDPHVCGERRAPGVLVLGPDRGVRDAVIVIEGIAKGKKPGEELRLDIRDCEFVPRVLAMMLGQRVRIRNGDPIVHNPQGRLGAVPVFNVALPERGQEIDLTRRFTQPGLVRLDCGVHPEMTGWIVVHDSPYFAVTDEDGAFEIGGIPPGTYRVTAWHEGWRPNKRRRGRPVYQPARRLTRTLRIAADAIATVEFVLR